MAKANLKIKKGEVVVLTRGAYSSYGIEGFVVAIKAFDIGEQARAYVAETEKDSYYNVDGFAAWLITKELVIPVDYREVYLGGYGRFSSDFGDQFKSAIFE